MAGALFEATLMGAWTQYRPVVYRVYYENEEGKRVSHLVLSKTGFTALVGALAGEIDLAKVGIAVIAPISLITLNKDIINKIKDNKYNFKNLCRDLSNTMISHLSPDIDVKNIKNNKLVIIINNKELELEEKNIIILNKIIVNTQIDESQGIDSDSDSREIFLPIYCKRNIQLHYMIARTSQNGVETSAGKVNADLYLLIVPLVYTQKTNNNLIIFREKNVEKINLELLLRALILNGMYAAMNDFLDSTYRDLLQKRPEPVDLRVAYDSSIGLNSLLPPYTYSLEALDPLLPIMITNRMADLLGIASEATIEIRSFLYSSDPVPYLGIRGKRDEIAIEYIKATQNDNINYSYRKLIEKTKLGLNVNFEDGKEVWKALRGALARVAGIRGLIDELVSRLPQTLKAGPDGPTISDIEDAALYSILGLYMFKLGLYHWGAVLADRLIQREILEKTAKDPLRLVSVSMRTSDGKVIIEYNINNTLTTMLEPHVTVAGIVFGREIFRYALTLSNILNAFKPSRTKNEERRCYTLEFLKLLVNDIHDKISLLKEGRAQRSRHFGPDADYFRAALSSFYTEIVEPGARVLVLSELDKLAKDDPAKILDHLLPRGFELQLRQCPVEDRTLDSPAGKLLCFYPTSQIPAKPKHVRNFIAHAGFTRLSRHWCLALGEPSDECTDEPQGSECGKGCRPHAVCVEKTLEPEVMLMIARPQ